MDEQIGRLWKELEERGSARDTFLCFFSDNGPGRGTPGRSQPFRGRKGSLFEGGIRVPAFCTWPGRVTAGAVSDFLASTSDYLPTVLGMLGIDFPDDRPLDGISLQGALTGVAKKRAKPIGFWHRDMLAWVDDGDKLISEDKGKTFALYDLLDDPGEQRNIAAMKPDRVERMRDALSAWIASCKRSARGMDY